MKARPAAQISALAPSRAPSRTVGSLAAGLAGLLLFGISALVERTVGAGGAGAGPAASGLIEEILKSLIVWGFASYWSASAARLKREVDRREARADGPGMALVAVAVFAASENAAYFAAFPDTGILARLAWALPLHVGTAEILALGFLDGGRPAGAGPAGAARRATKAALALAAAIAWHAAANAYAASSPRGAALAAPAIAFIIAAVALGAAFRRKAYIGGLLNGA